MHLVESQVDCGYDLIESKNMGELLAWQCTLFCSKEGETHNILCFGIVVSNVGSEIWDLVRAASFALSCGCLLFPWLNHNFFFIGLSHY